ncbi:MAG TPA: sigma-54 dependent transcriptional regulator [Candidatus Acidoferrales bacterium]|nr:sigma-54 dependent transcriptional regulator [Candidatus Acidoferrales bacterium]
MAHVLVVEDDAVQRSDLAEMVAACGFEVVVAGDGREALARIAATPVNAILTDLVMPRMDGISLLKEMSARGDHTPAIVLTACGGIDKAVSVVHDLKAFWFLEKPVQPGVLRTLLERAIEKHHLLQEADRLQRQLSYQGVLCELVGDSPCMQEIYSLLRQVAPTSASVLISGESGTGKELVARAIHSLSPRSAGPFIAINCAALPESLMESELFGHEKGAFTGAAERRAGCFEQAHHGTLLLDEIGEMPIATQAKLLRVIEESKVRRLGGSSDIPISVRVLAATNRKPEQAIENKHLREDLYYRLNVFHVSLPPLRERTQDIPALSGALIRDLNRRHGCRVTGLTAEVLERFQAFSWPGNVREMRNVIERAVIVAAEGEIELRHLPSSMGPGTATPPVQPAAVAAAVPDDVLQVRVGSRMEEVEEAFLRLTLKHTNNNKRKAAQMLGLCLRTLHNKLHAWEERKQGTVAAAAGGDQLGAP